jgi:histidyl-tRNA synthetase
VKWVRESLNKLGVNNVVFDPNIVRGFEYYTGVVFEIFDTSSENNRSLVGGGSYYNLTGLFDGESIPGAGFGMGDVTMRDFLETHGLLTSNITAPTLMVLPTDVSLNIEGEKIAQLFRNAGISASVDLSDRKLGKRLSAAGEAFVSYALVLGEDEIKKGEYVLKNLADGSEESGTIESLLKALS